jgi:hypothetical protein
VAPETGKGSLLTSVRAVVRSVYDSLFAPLPAGRWRLQPDERAAAAEVSLLLFVEPHGLCAEDAARPAVAGGGAVGRGGGGARGPARQQHTGGGGQGRAQLLRG